MDRPRLTHSLAARRYSRGLIAALALALCPPLLAQQPLDPLSASEIERATSAFLGDARVRTKLGSNTRFRILSVERHEHPKDVALTAERAADVIAYDYNTDEAISTVVGLTNNVVTRMIATSGSQPSLSQEELAEATELAMSNPAVRARLTSAGEDSKSLVVTHLFMTGGAVRPSCAVHRCVLLFFNTKDSVLDMTPIVDLSARAVEVP